MARQINIEFTVIWAIVFLQGFSWRYTASSQPNINILESTTVNPVLLFAIDTLVWLLIATVQVFAFLESHDCRSFFAHCFTIAFIETKCFSLLIFSLFQISVCSFLMSSVMVIIFTVARFTGLRT